MFDFTEDRHFFERLLCQPGETLEHYQELFDPRSPALKRREFKTLRPKLFKDLVAIHGPRCLIGYPDHCDVTSGLAVDHLIPLSSNKLNKDLRRLAPERGKKVLAQSFGSNAVRNLLIACSNCNNHKKHRFLEPDHLRQILTLTHAGDRGHAPTAIGHAPSSQDKASRSR
ncbi:MAG: hypothetical protein O3B65_04260 [Chloroflexi bacterium]|nr:hypothetical protein [Chloroflexota bacterium]